MTDGTVSIAAAAKINLYLHVTGRRDDGYHELDSLIAFAAIHDTIVLQPADTVELTIGGPFAGALTGDGENLVVAAARRLAECAAVRSGARIRLVKRLPVASGIGGGSADAAAALRGLGRLWGVDLAAEQWTALALDLGADVPICWHGHAAFVGGIGERIDPAPALPAAPVVLVNPGVAVSTPAVFKGRQGAFGTPARFDGAVPSVSALADLLAARRNDLFDAAAALEPVIAAVVGSLVGARGCLLARMSGSGATCFGLFGDDDAAQEAAARLAHARPDWWVVATRLLCATGDLATDREEAG